MDTGVDLLAPVDGIARLICRGFSMRQIASLYVLRVRFTRIAGVRCHRSTARHAAFLGRCPGARAEWRRWRKF
jgi:hypothetical protein